MWDMIYDVAPAVVASLGIDVLRRVAFRMGGTGLPRLAGKLAALVSKHGVLEFCYPHEYTVLRVTCIQAGRQMF
jgi:hypothetical protein